MLVKQTSLDSITDDTQTEAGYRMSDTSSLGQRSEVSSPAPTNQEEAVRNLTHLKQRKISTQLKVSFF